MVLLPMAHFATTAMPARKAIHVWQVFVRQVRRSRARPVINAMSPAEVISIVVDTPDRIARSFDIVDQVTGGHGLVTCEMVPALLVLDGGRREGSTDLADYRY